MKNEGKFDKWMDFFVGTIMACGVLLMFLMLFFIGGLIYERFLQ